jgi:hypothetical protein
MCYKLHPLLSLKFSHISLRRNPKFMCWRRSLESYKARIKKHPHILNIKPNSLISLGHRNKKKLLLFLSFLWGRGKWKNIKKGKELSHMTEGKR